MRNRAIREKIQQDFGGSDFSLLSWGEEDNSLEIPADICALIGLDEERNWVRVSEVNEFEWPSSDIRPRPDDPSRSDYGMIPEAFFLQIRMRLADLVTKNRLARAKR